MSLLDDVSLMITPNGVAEDVLFGVLPTPTTGNELITNGDFATDSDWVKGAGWAIAGNKATCSSGNASLTQSVGAVAGKTYKVTFTLSDYTSGTLNVDVGDSIASTFTSTGTYEIYLTTTNANGLEFYGGAFRGSITDVSIKSYLSSDINFTRATTATKVNSAGLVASVATGVPRLDYTGGGCPHILAEPQRTNTALYSSQADNAYWQKYQSTITANQTASPDGTVNADKIEVTGSTGLIFKSITAAGTLSFFAKDDAIGSAKFYIQVDGVGNAKWNSDGTLSSVTGGTASAGVNYGNGWFRFILNVTSGVVINYGLIDATSGDSIFIYGMQNEIGSYATSYIPTVAASVTRNKDVFTRTGIADLINDSEGVLYVEAKTTYDSSKSRRISLSDGTIGNRVSLEFDDSVENKIKAFISLNGTNQILEYTAPNLAQFNKIAIKYKVNDFAVWFNGTEVVTDTSGDVPTGMTRIGFDGGSGGDDFFGEVRNIQIYKTALSDTQLDDLTS